jgi:hypothetical protein
MKKIYHKFVRDRIPEIIEEAGKMARRPLALCGPFPLLDRPHRSPRPSQLRRGWAMSDIITPKRARDLNREGITDAQVMTAVTVKRIECGGFDMGYLLEWVEE